MKLSDLRANDPVIKRLLKNLAEANVQNPEYTAIKIILENGADGRCAAAEATNDDIQRIKNSVNYCNPDFDIFLSEYLNQRI